MKWLENEGGLKPYVIGNTPKKMSSNRHEEIMMWLQDEYRPAVANFAVLDDIESAWRCSVGISSNVIMIKG